MRSFVLATLVLPLLAVTALAQQTPLEKKKEVFEAEVFRRGDAIQSLGSWSDSSDAVVLDALAPPPDDSHKFFITVLTKDKDPESETLKRDFQTQKDLHSWIADGKDELAWAHYTVIRSEDATQREFFKDVKYSKLPLLIVQPPANGVYGDNSTIIAQSEGYDGDYMKLSHLIRDRITQYVKHLDRAGLVHAVGPNSTGELLAYDSPGQEEETDERGRKRTPPFGDPGEKVDPYAANGPFLTPPDVKPAPGPGGGITMQDIMDACPGAPAEFILQQLQSRPTSLDAVRMAWMLYQQQLKPQVQPAPNTGPSLFTSILALLGAGGFSALLVLALQAWRGFRKATGKDVILDDATFDKLITVLRGLGYQVQPPQNALPPALRSAAIKEAIVVKNG